MAIYPFGWACALIPYYETLQASAHSPTIGYIMWWRKWRKLDTVKNIYNCIVLDWYKCIFLWKNRIWAHFYNIMMLMVQFFGLLQSSTENFSLPLRKIMPWQKSIDSKVFLLKRIEPIYGWHLSSGSTPLQCPNGVPILLNRIFWWYWELRNCLTSG